MSSRLIKTRFAPSPTGFLHLGALRTALYCYLYAKRHDGKFVLRIENTDQKRTVPGAIDQIKNSLLWTGLKYDEFYIQSERLPLYRKHVEILESRGHVYRCYCSSDRLSHLREDGEKTNTRYDRFCLYLSPSEKLEYERQNTPFVYRMKIPNRSITMNDIVYGKMTFEGSSLDDQILLKADGYPTYHLANIVDDHETGITHVIRGSEWIPSTPKHLLLYEMLDWEPPAFAHLPLLVNNDNSKLSKRQGHASLNWYKDEGYLPEALLNFVLRLGWNDPDPLPTASSSSSSRPEHQHNEHSGNEEILTLPEMIGRFSLERINKGNCMVALKKLDWMNAMHIRRMISNDLDKVLDILHPKVLEAFPIHGEGKEYLKKVVLVSKERIKNFKDFTTHFNYFFADISFEGTTVQEFWNSKIVRMKRRKEILEQLQKKILAVISAENNAVEGSVSASQGITDTSSSSSSGVIHVKKGVINDNNIQCIINEVKDEEHCSYHDVVMLMRYYLTGSQVGPPIGPLVELLGGEKTLQRLAKAIQMESSSSSSSNVMM